MASSCAVVGGSIAGILAAAAAAPFFERILVLDRDSLGTDLAQLKKPVLSYDDLCQEASAHRSVFQSLQNHGLLPGGAEAIEKLLPGFKEMCIDSGAHFLGDDIVIGHNQKLNFGSGQIKAMPAPEGHCILTATRMLFERCVRAKLLEAYPNVSFYSPCKVDSIITDANSQSVTGVRLASQEELSASLIIDATGSRSRMIGDFLRDECGQHLETVTYDVGLSYHTRFFKLPFEVQQQRIKDRTCFAGYFAKAPLTDTAVLQIVEGEMYQVAINRMKGEKCGPSLDEFLSVLKSLPDQTIYQLVKEAEPIGPSHDALGTKGTRRHFFEKVIMPENYVVLGDAVAHLNPRFGSGMTAAALQAGALRDQLAKAAASIFPAGSSKRHFTAEQLRGYSNKIQHEAGKSLDLPYNMVRDGDLAYDFCKGPRPKDPLAAVFGAYFGGLIDLLPLSKQVATAWLEVTSFNHPPTKLFQLVVARQVIAHLVRSRWQALSQAAQLLIASVGLLLPMGVLVAVLQA